MPVRSGSSRTVKVEFIFDFSPEILLLTTRHLDDSRLTHGPQSPTLLLMLLVGMFFRAPPLDVRSLTHSRSSVRTSARVSQLARISRS